MGADLDLAQGAVVLGVAVMLARSDRAGDTFIGFAVHKKSSYFFGIDSVCPRKGKNISPRPGNFSRHTRHCTKALQAFDPRLYLAAQQASRCKRTQRAGDCMKFFPLKIISIHLNYFKNQARSRSAPALVDLAPAQTAEAQQHLALVHGGHRPDKYGLMGYTRAPCARAAWQRAASFIPLWTRTAR